MQAPLFLALLAAGAALNVVQDQSVSPVQKVIELLEDNKGKIVKDLAAEEKEMTEYMEFCDTTSTEKGYAIKTAVRVIADVTAKIQDMESSIAEGEEVVTSTSSMVAEKESQLEAANAKRATEKEEFQKNEKELLISIDELERAVAEIKQAAPAGLVQVHSSVRGTAQKKRDPMADFKTGIMVLSRIVDATWVNTNSRRHIQGLLQASGTSAEESADADTDDLRLREAPKAAAYESATGGITKTLEDMKEKAEEALSDARKTETNQEHSSQMMAQSLTDAIEAGKEKIETTKSNIASESEELGDSKSELVETEKNKASDEAYLASLTQECHETSDAWDARQADAKNEMAALDKAKEILAERVKVFVQTGGRTAAATRRTARDIDISDSPESATRRRVVEQLRTLSGKYSSLALMEMVNAAASDPFEKVRGLIESMITKLMEEAEQEATQKGFCDEEISKSKESETEKGLTLDKLKARLDSAVSKKAELEAAVKELEAEIAELDKSVAEATKLRQEESATNAQVAKDNKEAAEAVEQAMIVLKEYYEGTALVQTGAAAASGAPSFGGKKGDAASSILSILEMCGENFTKLYMETEQAEAEAAAAYKKMSQESTVSRTSKVAEVKGSESEIKSLDVAIKNHQEDYDVTSQELDAVLAYLDKLKPQCEAKAMSYEEKKARREAEIEGLKEALTTLGA